MIYNEKHNLEYDGSMIPAEWFGWMHYKTDLPPTVVRAAAGVTNEPRWPWPSFSSGLLSRIRAAAASSPSWPFKFRGQFADPFNFGQTRLEKFVGKMSRRRRHFEMASPAAVCRPPYLPSCVRTCWIMWLWNFGGTLFELE